MRPREGCAHCGGRFGLVTYRWWGSRFCKKACKDAHLREAALGRHKLLGWYGCLPVDETASDISRAASGLPETKGPPS
jgi:hypothetical protein